MLQKRFLLLFSIALLFNACSPSEEELVEKGISLMKEEAYTEPSTYVHRAILENDSSFTAHNTRGVAYFELGNIENAIASYSKAIAIDSNDYKPFYNRRNAYIETGKQ